MVTPARQEVGENKPSRLGPRARGERLDRRVLNAVDEHALVDTALDADPIADRRCELRAIAFIDHETRSRLVADHEGAIRVAAGDDGLETDGRIRPREEIGVGDLPDGCEDLRRGLRPRGSRGTGERGGREDGDPDVAADGTHGTPRAGDVAHSPLDPR